MPMIERHVIEGEVRLCFDGRDLQGFGHATDPDNEDRNFLLNQDTAGPWQDLKPDQHFMARVTEAHYVAEVTQPLA